MNRLSMLFILGIPLASFFFRIVVGLTGGHRIPLAWTFSYYSALSITSTSAFILARIDCRSKLRLATLATLFSVCLGSSIGLASAEAGILGSPYEDPLRGNVPFTDAVFCAFIGALSGLGLGLGSSRWMQVLMSRKVHQNLALALCFLTTLFSTVIALSIALLL
ncbi:MAG: hypothetical protein F6J87_26485 [Spirulina sp. SIO3F2]|nr:hypothetical protein [Spirulina sp. SIO3F2]